MVLRYCGYFLMMTGGFLWLGNIMWAAVRFGSDLIIPFSAEKKLFFHYGPTFYLCFVAGLVAVLSGFIVFIMDIRFPNELTTFFNVDPLADYEETFVYDKRNGASNGASNGGPAEPEAKSWRKVSALRKASTRPRRKYTPHGNQGGGQQLDNGDGIPMKGYSSSSLTGVENPAIEIVEA